MVICMVIQKNQSQENLFALKNLQKYKELCVPFINSGFGHFVHDISFQKGELSMLSTNPGLIRLYDKERLPAIYTDENGRTLKPGIYLSDDLEKRNKLYCTLSQNLKKFVGIKNYIFIIEHDEDCHHAFTLLPNTEKNNDSIHWLINNIYYLRNSIERYKAQAEKIIIEIKEPKYRIQLPIIRESETTKIHKINIRDQFTIFHKEGACPIHLSKQQSICLKLMAEGKSSKQIGLEMNISFRTVEHYLERIRKLLGCNSNKKLIADYANQIFG